MDFNHTEDRRMLADMAGRFVREQYPIEKRHEIAAGETGMSDEMWSAMAELGLIGALFPEEVGGFGGAGFDVTIVFEELGKGLVVEPFLPALLAGRALQSGSDAQLEVLGELISGEVKAALAHGEPASRYTLNHVETSATRSGDNYLLSGNKAVVLGGNVADQLIVSARTSGAATDAEGISLFLVAADQVSRKTYSTVDGYGAAELAFDNVEVAAENMIGAEGTGLNVIRDAYAWGTLAVCAEALGAVEVAIDLTLEYLKTRKQFGIPIGKFQALQHRMADMMTEREQIRSAIINAAGNMDTKKRDWFVSAAKDLVGRSGRMIAEESIQMHGGIAMTWEYAVGHFAKRIVMIDHLFGDTDHHKEALIRMAQSA